jgi:hypothetical protein
METKKYLEPEKLIILEAAYGFVPQIFHGVDVVILADLLHSLLRGTDIDRRTIVEDFSRG